VMSYAFDGEMKLAKIAAELNNGQAERWRTKAKATQKKLINYLWRPEKHACYDRGPDNRFMDVLIHNNLRCMYYGIFTQQMADEFVRHHLLNPEEFWTPMPLVSIAANDPKFRNIPRNNWSGPPQGLTYQRALRALENYGHYAELTLVGERFLEVTGKTLKFTQQYDPQTGQPQHGGRSATYGPSVLATLQYIAHLYGVELDEDRVWFSGRSHGKHTHQYSQWWNGRAFTVRLNGDVFEGLIEDRKVFTCSSNVRVVTDLTGRLIQLVGISPKSQTVSIQWGESRQTLTVKPNQTYTVKPKERFELERSVPFDYPYKRPGDKEATP